MFATVAASLYNHQRLWLSPPFTSATTITNHTREREIWKDFCWRREHGPGTYTKLDSLHYIQGTQLQNTIRIPELRTLQDLPIHHSIDIAVPDKPIIRSSRIYPIRYQSSQTASPIGETFSIPLGIYERWGQWSWNLQARQSTATLLNRRKISPESFSSYFPRLPSGSPNF